MNKFYVFAILFCFANLALCQNDTTTSSTEPITESSTETTTLTTTTLETTTLTTTVPDNTTSTTPETTTTSTTSTTTTTPETTTTTTEVTTTTTTTTQQPSTSTSANPDVDRVFDFTVPKNTSLPTCLRAKFSLSFSIQYPMDSNGTKSNGTLKFNLDDSNYNDFSGECNETVDTLSVMLHNDWTLMIKYTLKNSAFELDAILLNYTVDSQMFPNVSADFIGKHTVFQSGLHEFSANKGNSYKCTSKTTMTIQELVTLEFKNYQAQPFINPDSKSKDFDTAIECSADTTSTSKLVPIIVGSALAVLVVLVLIAYIVGRRKHRPGYQSV